ncbi:claudin-34-like [Pagrus major]|uniref:claudin-34-like n=1 Tax=Pagrus major TaxID=143350 RepID=UPI003CC8B3CA
MASHAHTTQLYALVLGFIGWTLTAVALGLIQWRVWQVSHSEVISSGVAWVGLWRACFDSHTLVTPRFTFMHCRSMGLTEAFTPPEVAAGQVLMLLSLVVGLCGNAGGVYAVRNIYFGLEKNSPIRLAFFTTGALCLLAAVMSLIPLLWNLSSVLTNQTIRFPPEFKMPRAPESQHVGGGVMVGLVGAVLMIVSGMVFCSYRLPASSQRRPALRGQAHLDVPVQAVAAGGRGTDNPAFESQEHL